MASTGPLRRPRRVAGTRLTTSPCCCHRASAVRAGDTARRRSPSQGQALLSRIGRWPAALLGLLVGALVPWSVNAYAPRVVESASSTPLLEATLGFDSDVIDDGWQLALPRPVDRADIPRAVDSCEALRRWGLARSAADVETTWLRLSLRGTRLDPVQVTRIRVVVEQRKDPYTGSKLGCDSAGAEDAENVVVLLDEVNPVLRTETFDGQVGEPWFRRNSLTLERNEVVDFAIRAEAYKAAYTWRLEADVRDGDRTTVVPLGESLRTSAASGAYASAWDWAWHLDPPRIAPDG